MESPFLKLPGEIRNRIYEFVLADEGKSVKVQHLKRLENERLEYERLIKINDREDTLGVPDFIAELFGDLGKHSEDSQKVSTEDKSEVSTEDNLAVSQGKEEKPVKENPAAGTYARLTRVCRQIRKEFLPMQQRNARVRLEKDDLYEFIDTFATDKNPMKELIIVAYVEDHDEIYDDDDLMYVIERQVSRLAQRMACHTIIQRYCGNDEAGIPFQGWEEVAIQEWFGGRRGDSWTCNVYDDLQH
ncbi:hypothetical protein SLS60_009849 [Paraconiothyrium brasiliense]|uniref:Uncharacterized protein n=1 Tax=Paraconiothyrium brasiliense TaxID=300254 RepID=A0ABR3QSN0_9PLEO